MMVVTIHVAAVVVGVAIVIAFGAIAAIVVIVFIGRIDTPC